MFSCKWAMAASLRPKPGAAVETLLSRDALVLIPCKGVLLQQLPLGYGSDNGVPVHGRRAYSDETGM